VNRCLHQAIFNARYPWVLQCDDDDEVICDVRRDMMPFCAPDVGVIVGSKFVRLLNGTVEHREPREVRGPMDLPGGMPGSVRLYNRDAFWRIYPNLDLNHPREEFGPDYGYFWDWKIGYWLLRAGYRVVDCGVDVCVENLNPNRSEKMKRLEWGQVVRNRDRRGMITQ